MTPVEKTRFSADKIKWFAGSAETLYHYSIFVSQRLAFFGKLRKKRCTFGLGGVSSIFAIPEIKAFSL
jgi:hypothetical protein